MPEPWAICSRDSRTAPLVASTQTSGARLAVPDHQLGCAGVGDPIDLGRRGSGGALGRDLGRGAADRDRRLLGDRGGDDLALGIGVDDEVAADDAQSLVGPLIGHGEDAGVTGVGAGADEGVLVGTLELVAVTIHPGNGCLLGLEAGIACRGGARWSGQADQCTKSQLPRCGSMRCELQIRATRRDARPNSGSGWRPIVGSRRMGRWTRDSQLVRTAGRVGVTPARRSATASPNSSCPSIVRCSRSSR